MGLEPRLALRVILAGELVLVPPGAVSFHDQPLLGPAESGVVAMPSRTVLRSGLNGSRSPARGDRIEGEPAPLQLGEVEHAPLLRGESRDRGGRESRLQRLCQFFR
jgi:hypothetical protein